MRKWYALLLLALFSTACGPKPDKKFADLAEEFVYTTLAFSPVSATAAGLHRYQDRSLDEMLDDVSPSSFDHQRQFYQKFRERLAREAPLDKLNVENRVDSDIIGHQIELALIDLNETQPFLHSPVMYVELAGNAIFTPLVLEYDPTPQRIRHIIARLREFPLFFDQARSNLTSSPDIWTSVAIEENEGNIRLVDKTIRDAVPPQLRADYDPVAKTALEALQRFQDYLKTSLAKRKEAAWRLGRDKYSRKFIHIMATSAGPEAVLAQAEKDLERVRGTMLKLAEGLHRSTYAAHRDHPELKDPDRTNRIISEVLARIAERHPTREGFMGEARRNLDEARHFVKANGLLSLPPRTNLQVIETPEFMRGIYTVAGFAPAPALEPQLGAFYWVTPIPKDWPPARAESKLREYNTYALQLITIHEAMPGHYVQFEFANEVQPKVRRLLRTVYANGPYVEGWAQYATQMMLEAGYSSHSPELALTFYKQQLRVIANAILDIRLHMLDMPEQEALDLMQKQTFQETEEAQAKLQRAKLSSCQLPTYYVGWDAWLNAESKYKQQKGASYNPLEFRNRAIRESAVPVPSLAGLLTGQAPAATPSK